DYLAYNKLFFLSQFLNFIFFYHPYMDNSISILSLVFLLLLLFADANNSIATSYGGVESIRRKIVLHEIIFDLGRKMKNMQINNKRALVDEDRLAPGGPDPQHH
ncbi:hypothetical protein AABB24_036813, partial [Solanum stoloniferum]